MKIESSGGMSNNLYQSVGCDPESSLLGFIKETGCVNQVILQKAQGSIYPLQIFQCRSDHASMPGLILDKDLINSLQAPFIFTLQ